MQFRTAAIALVTAFAWLASSAIASDTPALTEADAAEIYAGVVSRLIGQDDTFDGNLHPAKVFIQRELQGDCPVPAPRAGCARRTAGRIAPGLEARLAAALAGRHADIRFVDSRKALQFDPRTGEIRGGGVLVTLSELVTAKPGEIETNGEIYIANEGAGQMRYEFAHAGAHWSLASARSGWIS